MRQGTTDSTSRSDCRRLITWPLGLFAGVLVGGAAVMRWQASPIQAVLAGLATAFLATRAREWLEARTAALFSDDAGAANAGALALGLDLAIGAVVGLVAAPLLGGGVLAAIGAGAVLAGLWSLVMGWVFCGEAVDHAVDFLMGGSQSSDFALEPILADGEALENAGRADAAILKYREVAEHHPTQLEAYLRAARLLSQQGRPREAASLLRQARSRARLSSGQEVLVGRQLADLASGPLADPTLAAAELALLAGRFRGSPAGDAAERDLQRLRADKRDLERVPKA